MATGGRDNQRAEQLAGERLEEAGLRTLIDGEPDDLGTVHQRRPGRRVLALTHQDVAERALTGPVGAHQGVDLAEGNRQIDTLEDLQIAEAGLEARYLQCGAAHQASSPGSTVR